MSDSNTSSTLSLTHRKTSDDDLLDADTESISEVSPLLRRTSSSHSVSFVDMSRLLLVPDFDFGSGFLEMGDSTMKKINDMKNKTKEKLRKLKDDNGVGITVTGRRFLSQDAAKFQASLNRRLSRFDDRVHRSLQSSATEKAFYAAAVMLIAVGGFIIGKYPTYFPIFHTAMFCALMPIRFYTYFKQSFQYYLADLCYYVNVLLLLFLWVFPNSKSLFISVFSLTLGTLCFAVITWRNSLVLHSIDKTTSSIIHFMPPITIFVLVHEMPKEYVAKHYPAIAQVESWNFVNGIIITSIYYTIWQVSYHYFITVRRKEQIAKGRVTSFTYLRQKNSKSLLGRFVNGLPYTWMQIAAFTLIQFFYQILTMLPCPLWFRYKHLCGAFVMFIFAWSAYNGATYYIEVFGKRFEKEVATLKLEINELQQQISRHEAERSTPSFSPVLEPLPSEPMEELRLLKESPQMKPKN
ncbi:hypothetical protein PUMCH_003656 [Australozyma saopauloensis]|uniref:Glycerophosphocholine acyltransferase 1 n=1 Tax=Australozyma saopauloensis TaxID=291208 RepID=A0AAX4HEK3_9ASCO|nr:hypothetical protein PUMCH_003656 [[Candida] saopauloensis]